MTAPEGAPSRPVTAFHPGAKVLAVLLVAVTVMAARSPWGLVATGAVVAVAALRVPGAVAAFLGLVRRLRWVFLFIILLHGWFAPGPVLLPALGGWSPSLPGLGRGAELVAVVVLMAGLVAALIRSTPAPDLAAGVAWVLAPLARLGLPVERFSRLLAWTVDRVEPVRREARLVRDALWLRRPPDRGVRGRLWLEAETARALLRRAHEAADRNAEALYLRQAGSVRRLAPPRPADLGLVAGALAWAALLVMGVTGEIA